MCLFMHLQRAFLFRNLVALVTLGSLLERRWYWKLLRGAVQQELWHAQCTPTCSSCSLPGAKSPYSQLAHQSQKFQEEVCQSSFCHLRPVVCSSPKKQEEDRWHWETVESYHSTQEIWLLVWWQCWDLLEESDLRESAGAIFSHAAATSSATSVGPLLNLFERRTVL